MDESQYNAAWIHPFACGFVGLDQSGVVRRGIGTVSVSPDRLCPAAELVGRSWQNVVADYADASAQEGLRTLWQATAGGYVAPAYWPDAVPFAAGITARLRPASDDPAVVFTAQLSGETGSTLDATTGPHTLDALQRAIRLGQHIHRGADGPLTDLQVKDVRAIIDRLEHTHRLLDDLQAALLTPTITAPQPHVVSELLGFSAQDFTSHRLITHRLRIQNNLSAQMVYCQPGLRASVQAVIDALLGIINAESAVTLSDEVNDQDRAVDVTLHFESREPGFRVTERIDPLALTDPARFEPTPPVRQLVTTMQARLSPVRGSAWADTCSGENQDAACFRLRLPRWQEPDPPSS